LLSLQALLKALETRASEAETNFSQAKSESEERLKRAEQAEAKTTETQEALQRFVLYSKCEILGFGWSVTYKTGLPLWPYLLSLTALHSSNL